MRISENDIQLSFATKLFNFLYVKGRITSPSSSAKISQVKLSSTSYEIQQQNRIFASLNESSPSRNVFEFEIHVILSEPYDLISNLDLVIEIDSGDVQSFSLAKLTSTVVETFPTNKVLRDFCDQIRAKKGAKVLDLGGRDRSRIDRSQSFPGVDFTVLDIVPSENVDVVGDAHELSRYFARDTFDYMISMSVFEHLAMPWKVAVEMNKVMKMGGLALVQAPQSIGMHDLPWDFWRFSDSAWNTIFNEETGFRVVAKFRDYPNFILPFLIREIQLDAEKAAGFEISMVIVEKVARTKEKWRTNLSTVVEGNYPSN